MSSDTRKVNLGRTDGGDITYGLTMQGARKYNAAFAGVAEIFIDLQDNDSHAFFFPTPGVNYEVSDDTLPVFPAAVDAAAMVEANIVLNPAVLVLENWPSLNGTRRIYIRSTLPQFLTVMVYSK